MKTLLVSCAFILCMSFSTHAQVANTQTVSDWSPVPAKTEDDAKSSKTKSFGKGAVKLRSTSKGLGSQSPSTSRDTAVQTITTAGPTTAKMNEVVIGPCCDCNRILLDGLFLYQNVTLSLFSGTPNSTVPVTLGHGGPGRIGFSLNLNGPWVDSLDFNVNTDSNGTGSAVITFYIKGLDAGQSNMTTTVSTGFTNPVPQMEVFACQCPPAPGL
jgi:hypothetical protein